MDCYWQKGKNVTAAPLQMNLAGLWTRWDLRGSLRILVVSAVSLKYTIAGYSINSVRDIRVPHLFRPLAQFEEEAKIINYTDCDNWLSAEDNRCRWLSAMLRLHLTAFELHEEHEAHLLRTWNLPTYLFYRNLPASLRMGLSKPPYRDSSPNSFPNVILLVILIQ